MQNVSTIDTKKPVPILSVSDFVGYSADTIAASEAPIVPLDQIDLLEIEPLRMTSLKIVLPLNPIVMIGSSNVSTPGNVTTFSGEGKSGKTAALGALMAGAIREGGYDGFENLNVALNKHKRAVIHVETEQSESRHQVNHKTILQRAGLFETPPYFLSYNIRRNPIDQYKSIVEKACKGAMEKFGGVYLIVIDGGADFISDVNEAGEANALVKWLEELAITFQAPVIVVVHVNPGSDKERGHLGSQLQRKSESLLLIKRKDDISTIEAKLLRNAGIGDTPHIQFTYDKLKGYHVSCGTAVPELDNKDLLRIAKIKSIAKTAFKNNLSLGYKEAIEQIIIASNKSEAPAKNMFKEMKVRGIITQTNDKKWALNLQQV